MDPLDALISRHQAPRDPTPPVVKHSWADRVASLDAAVVFDHYVTTLPVELPPVQRPKPLCDKSLADCARHHGIAGRANRFGGMFNAQLNQWLPCPHVFGSPECGAPAPAGGVTSIEVPLPRF